MMEDDGSHRLKTKMKPTVITMREEYKSRDEYEQKNPNINKQTIFKFNFSQIFKSDMPLP